MSDETKVELDESTLDTEDLVNDPRLMSTRARNIEMFKDYFKGMPIVQIAAKYKISRQRIQRIKNRDKWSDLVQEIRDRAYAQMSNEWKDFLSSVTVTLKKDWERLMQKMMKDDALTLNPDQRAHGRMMLDSLIKATRLADERPTEITKNTGGVVKHQIVLPHGVKHFGVIPPAQNVEFVEAEPEEKKTQPKISIEDIEKEDA